MLIQTGGSAPRQNLQVSFPPSWRGCLVLFLVLFFKEKKKKNFQIKVSKLPIIYLPIIFLSLEEAFLVSLVPLDLL